MKMIISFWFAAAVIFAVSTTAFADSPRRFLQNALEGDNSEIMLGRLAADKARSQRVREFGRVLSDDHSQAREDLLRLGTRLGVRRNRDISPEAKDERERLQSMDGREFDREFIEYMIRDHQKDIEEFREEAQERHGPVSEFASRQLPTLQKHLEMAMDLDRSGPRNRYGRDRDDQYRGDHNYRNGSSDNSQRDGFGNDRGLESDSPH